MSGTETGAGDALAQALIAALNGVTGLNGAYDGPPLQAAFPYAMVETGPETDWSHKSGAGRELRVAVTIRDKGEKPARLRALVGEAEGAIGGLAGRFAGWRLVTLVFLRSVMLRESGAAWAATIEYRARLLAET